MKLAILFAAAAAVFHPPSSAANLKSRQLYCSKASVNLNDMFLSYGEPSEFCKGFYVGHGCFLQGDALGDRIPGKCINADGPAFDGACFCQALESGQRYQRPLADAVEERELETVAVEKCVGPSANAHEMTYDACQGHAEGSRCKLQEPGTQTGEGQYEGKCARAHDGRYNALNNCYCHRVATFGASKGEYTASPKKCSAGASQCLGEVEGSIGVYWSQCGRDRAGNQLKCRRVNSMFGECHCLE